MPLVLVSGKRAKITAKSNAKVAVSMLQHQATMPAGHHDILIHVSHGSGLPFVAMEPHCRPGPVAQPDTMHPPPRHPAGGDAAHAGDVLISEFPGAEIWHDVTPAWLYLFKVRFADAGTCTHSGLLN